MQNILIHEDGSPLTQFQFNAVLKKMFAHIGLSSFHFMSDSLRIGAATEAVRMELDEAFNKKLGRWNSRRYGAYVSPNLCL